MYIPTPAQCDARRIARGGLRAFARDAFAHVPGVTARPPLWNWHFDLACDHYQALYEGEITTGLVNLPPGTIKSTIGSVIVPAWIWSLNPEYQFLMASYGGDLARRFANAHRDLCLSTWYRDRWGDIIVGGTKAAASSFWTRYGGFRESTTPRAKGTGLHCDWFGIDDPVSAEQAKAAKLNALMYGVNNWHDSTVRTRGKPEAPMRVSITMQRLHEDDLSGHVLSHKPEHFDHLCLPARYEPERADPRDPRTREGDWLWELPARIQEWSDFARTHGGWTSPLVRTQYQQDPRAGTGVIFTSEMIRTFTLADMPIEQTVACISVDPTFDGKPNSDYVAIEVWGIYNGCFYLYHSEVVRRTFKETCDAIRECYRRFPTTQHVLVEQSANGPAIVNTLASEIRGVEAVPVRGGAKEARATAASYHFAEGRVFLLADAPWLAHKVRRLLRFPAVANDDDIDTTSQAILWLHDKYGVNKHWLAGTIGLQSEILAIQAGGLDGLVEDFWGDRAPRLNDAQRFRLGM